MSILANSPWSPCFEFAEFVDFCIWVLEVDGLHVLPFDQHPPGNQELQTNGFDALSWQIGLKKL